MEPIRIALDLSCATEARRTGVGYAAIYQVQALLRRTQGLDLRLVATRPRGGANPFHGQRTVFSRSVVVPRAGRLKYLLWSRFDWPPIEWFSGPVDLAHNFSHQVPATKKAVRLVTIHDLSFICLPETHTTRTVRLQTALIRQCVRRADAFVAVSESTKRDLVERMGVEPGKVHTVPNGVCLDELEEEFDEEAAAGLRKHLGITRPYFIHLGTLEPRKNLPRLLAAYARLRERMADAPQLLLVGKPGWLHEPIFEAMAPLRETGDVVYAGYLERRDALVLLRGAVACVYPSLYEGFGLPVLEAMACGTPVVSSTGGALPEVVGDTGILVEPEDSDAIEAGLVEVLENPAAARARAEAARRRAELFTWERSAECLAGVYRRLVT